MYSKSSVLKLWGPLLRTWLTIYLISWIFSLLRSFLKSKKIKLVSFGFIFLFLCLVHFCLRNQDLIFIIQAWQGTLDILLGAYGLLAILHFWGENAALVSVWDLVKFAKFPTLWFYLILYYWLIDCHCVQWLWCWNLCVKCPNLRSQCSGSISLPPFPFSLSLLPPIFVEHIISVRYMLIKDGEQYRKPLLEELTI